MKISRNPTTKVPRFKRSKPNPSQKNHK